MSVSVNDRLKLIKECKSKYNKILLAKAKHVSELMLQAGPLIRDLTVTYMSVVGNVLFEPLPESAYFKISIPNANETYDCSFKSVNNIYHVHNGYFCLGDNIKEMNEYRTQEPLIRHLIILGNDKMTDIEKFVGDLQAYYIDLCNHIDTIINSIDAEYGLLFSDETKINISEAYSKENINTYVDGYFDDMDIEQDLQENDFDLTDECDMEFNIGLQYIPDLAAHRYKSYYEVTFKNATDDQMITFMIHNSKCKVIDRLSVKLILEPSIDYTVYITGNGKNETRIVDGYGLRNICKYCKIMI